MQRKSFLWCIFLSFSLMLGACSGKKNHPSDNQQANNSATLGTRSDSQNASRDDKGKGVFTFQINDKTYTATTTKPSIYSDVSDTSSVFGIVATYKESKDQGIIINLNLQLEKRGLKTKTYSLGDARNDDALYKASYIVHEKNRKISMGPSQKGTLTITDYKQISDHEGVASGKFEFTGNLMLITTASDNPSKEPFTAKGQFVDIPLSEYHGSN